MAPTDLNRVILIVAALVAAVGTLDAALSGDLDLALVFALVALLQLALLVRLQGRRPSIPLRADLVAWLRDRAAAHGEPIGALADRCVAACRADLDRT